MTFKDGFLSSSSSDISVKFNCCIIKIIWKNKTWYFQSFNIVNWYFPSLTQCLFLTIKFIKMNCCNLFLKNHKTFFKSINVIRKYSGLKHYLQTIFCFYFSSLQDDSNFFLFKVGSMQIYFLLVLPVCLSDVWNWISV